MWDQLGKFEGFIFLLPFYIFARLHGIPYSTKCRQCGKRLFSIEDSRTELCWKCQSQSAIRYSADYYDRSYGRAINISRYVRPAERPRFKRIIEKVGPGIILDAGCGRGVLLAGLESEYRQLYGIDISLAAVNMARTLCQNANLLVADINRLPFKSNTFDFIVCSDVTEHLEGADYLREFYRVLKPNGSLLITVPNGKGRKAKMPGHVRFFSAKSFTRLLGGAGFESCTVYKFGFYIPFISYLLELVSLGIGKVLPFAGPLNIRVPEFLAVYFLAECRKSF